MARRLALALALTLLALGLTASPASAAVVISGSAQLTGDGVQYTIKNEASSQTLVRVTALAPEGTNFTAALASRGSCEYTGRFIDCAGFALPAGESMTVNGKAGGLQAGQEHQLCADGDPSGSACVNVQAKSVAISGSAQLAPSGVQYTIKNESSSTRAVSQVSALAPEGTSFAGASASRGSCTYDGRFIQCSGLTLAPGESMTVNGTAQGLGSGQDHQLCGSASGPSESTCVTVKAEPQSPGTTPPTDAPPSERCECFQVFAWVVPKSIAFYQRDRGNMHLDLDVRWAIWCTSGEGGCSGELKLRPPEGVKVRGPLSKGNRPRGTTKIECEGPCNEITIRTARVHLYAGPRYGSGRKFGPKELARRGLRLVFERLCGRQDLEPETITLAFKTNGLVDKPKSDLNGDGKTDGRDPDPPPKPVAPPPPPKPPGPCECEKVDAAVRGRPFSSASITPQGNFIMELSLRWELTCTEGAGDCAGEVVLRPQRAYERALGLKTLWPRSVPPGFTGADVQCRGPCLTPGFGAMRERTVGTEKIGFRAGPKYGSDPIDHDLLGALGKLEFDLKTSCEGQKPIEREIRLGFDRNGFFSLRRSDLNGDGKLGD